MERRFYQEHRPVSQKLNLAEIAGHRFGSPGYGKLALNHRRFDKAVFARRDGHNAIGVFKRDYARELRIRQRLRRVAPQHEYHRQLILLGEHAYSGLICLRAHVDDELISPPKRCCAGYGMLWKLRYPQNAAIRPVVQLHLFVLT